MDCNVYDPWKCECGLHAEYVQFSDRTCFCYFENIDGKEFFFDEMYRYILFFHIIVFVENIQILNLERNNLKILPSRT